MLACASKRPEEREFEVDSGISSDEMDTVKRSRTPTVVLTANGEVHTDEEAQVFVHDLNSYYDGNRRNQIRESICVSSTSSKDFP